ncbi:hypothetical protein C8R42DRAFT_595761, partial [Lentinula raphanica]
MKYNGEKDEQKFHRFAKASSLYIKDGRVPVRREVNIISNFLEGHAYTFYHSLCGDNPEQWTLHDFFTSMYNYFFPVNYRMEQRRKLLTFTQKGKKVKEHVRIFEELCNSVGIRDERQKVSLLWESFYPSIIAELYRKSLDPETSSFIEVISWAERIELIEDLNKKNAYSSRFANENQNRYGTTGYGTTGSSSAKNGNNDNKPAQRKEFDSQARQSPSGTKGPNPVQTGKGGNRNQNGSARSRDSGGRKLLSEKEKNEYRAAGKCFECGETTHKARDCPKKTGVKGDAKKPNNPPGLSTYNLEFELVEKEESDCVCELTVGKLDWFTDVEDTLYSSESSGGDTDSLDDSFENDSLDEGLPPLVECSDESDSDSDWSSSSEEEDDDTPFGPTVERETSINGHEAINSSSDFLDPISMRARDLLHWGAPYPGEDRYDSAILNPERFIVCRILLENGGGGFLILDTAYEDREYTLPMFTMEDPDFRIVHWYAKLNIMDLAVPLESRWGNHRPMGDAFKLHIILSLLFRGGLPGDSLPVQIPSGRQTNRFNAYRAADESSYVIEDRWLGFTFSVPLQLLRDHRFDIKRWICKRYMTLYQDAFKFPMWEDKIDLFGNLFEHRFDKGPARYMTDDTYGGLQRNAATVKDPARKVARPIIVVVRINKQPVRALLDSGSLGDFMSTKLADQLNLRRRELPHPLILQLAVQGSRSKVNWEVDADFEYQKINERRTFDVANIANCDLILGTKFLHEHCVTIGFNQCRVVIGSATRLPLEGPTVSRITSNSLDVVDDEVQRAREDLFEYAKPLCRTMDQTDLPPLREINHRIPLIDRDLVIPWRPSRLPEKFREQWVEKRDAYIKSGRWRITTANNTVPLLLIPKPG